MLSLLVMLSRANHPASLMQPTCHAEKFMGLQPTWSDAKLVLVHPHLRGSAAKHPASLMQATSHAELMCHAEQFMGTCTHQGQMKVGTFIGAQLSIWPRFLVILSKFALNTGKDSRSCSSQSA